MTLLARLGLFDVGAALVAGTPLAEEWEAAKRRHAGHVGEPIEWRRDAAETTMKADLFDLLVRSPSRVREDVLDVVARMERIEAEGPTT